MVPGNANEISTGKRRPTNKYPGREFWFLCFSVSFFEGPEVHVCLSVVQAQYHALWEVDNTWSLICTEHMDCGYLLGSFALRKVPVREMACNLIAEHLLEIWGCPACLCVARRAVSTPCPSSEQRLCTMGLVQQAFFPNPAFLQVRRHP